MTKTCNARSCRTSRIWGAEALLGNGTRLSQCIASDMRMKTVGVTSVSAVVWWVQRLRMTTSREPSVSLQQHRQTDVSIRLWRSEGGNCMEGCGVESGCQWHWWPERGRQALATLNDKIYVTDEWTPFSVHPPSLSLSLARP